MGSSGSKSPAGSTLSLIFYCSNDPTFSPIDFPLKACIDIFNDGIGGMWSSFSKVSVNKLLLSNIHELIGSHFPCLSGIGVVILDFLEGGLEDSESVLEFSRWWNIFAKLMKIGQILSS